MKLANVRKSCEGEEAEQEKPEEEFLLKGSESLHLLHLNQWKSTDHHLPLAYLSRH